MEDLKKAAEEYADKHGFRVPYDGSNKYYDDVDVEASKEGFLAGANWMKEQMEKEVAKVVEAHVDATYNPTEEEGQTHRGLTLIYEDHEGVPWIKAGDNIRLIVFRRKPKESLKLFGNLK